MYIYIAQSREHFYCGREGKGRRERGKGRVNERLGQETPPKANYWIRPCCVYVCA